MLFFCLCWRLGASTQVQVFDCHASEECGVAPVQVDCLWLDGTGRQQQSESWLVGAL